MTRPGLLLLVALVLAVAGCARESRVTESPEPVPTSMPKAPRLLVEAPVTFRGMVPCAEPHGLARGDAARFRVTNVLPDGKVELSLRGHAHEELETDAAHVLSVLARPSTPRFGDRTSPEQVRAWFGLSKKAFKRAVGRLLKQGAVELDGDGSVRLVKGYQAVGR